MKKYDIITLVIYLIVLAILTFFWGCGLDLWVTIGAVVLVTITTIYMVMQHKKLQKLQKEVA